MSQSEPTTELTKAGNVIEALNRIMAELPGIGKDEKADPRQGGYAYRGIESITRAVQPLLARHGVVIVPRVQSHEVVDIMVADRPWTDTRLLVVYTVYGPGGPGDYVEIGPILAIGRDNSDKGANKCMTQAFKYLLLQLFCVSDAKDDADAASVERDARPRASEGPRSHNPVPTAVVEGSPGVDGETGEVDQDIRARNLRLLEEHRGRNVQTQHAQAVAEKLATRTRPSPRRPMP